MDRQVTIKSFLAAGALALALVAPSAQATVETITIGVATGAISGGPYATVTLDDHGTTGSVHVSISALSGFGLVDTGAGDPLLFNISGNPTLTIGGNLLNLTAGFGPLDQPTGNQDGTGSWMYGIQCTSGCAQSNGGFGGTLSFDVVIAGITTASFISTSDSNNFRFATDVCVRTFAASSGAPNGCSATGDAANGSSSTSSTSSGGSSASGGVPEPNSTSLALLGVALLSITLFRRRQATAG